MDRPKKLLIFIKFEYLNRYGEPNEEIYNITATEQTTIKDLKDEINESFIYGELNNEQYEIYKGGEQENKEITNREPMTYYYKYIEPQLLEDDKTITDYNIIDDELLYLKAKLKIFLYNPCCRFNPIYIYTCDDLEQIKKETLKICSNNNLLSNTTAEQIKAFYGNQKLDEYNQLTMYKIYNLSTIDIHF